MPEAKQPFGLKPLWGKMQMLLRNSSADVYALAETDGTIKNSVYGKASSTLTSIKVETTGEQDIVLHGKLNGTSTIGALNVNASNVLRVELVNGGTIQVDPVLIPSSEGLLWNPGTTSASLYEVMFNITNQTATAVSGVHVGVDIGAGGSLAVASAEYWVFGRIISANDQSGWYGPFTIDGADRVRGVCGTATALAIHWRIRQVF